jgi:hypothetical protein
MKKAVEIGSGTRITHTKLRKIGLGIQNLIGRIHRHTDTQTACDIISFVILFQNKGSRIKRQWTVSNAIWNFGLCPSSGILKNIREHNASETGSVSILR